MPREHWWSTACDASLCERGVSTPVRCDSILPAPWRIPGADHAVAMRATHLARATLVFWVAFASTSGALAQPPAHAKRSAESMTARVRDAAALAYLSAKQALVGLHAVSERPVLHDDAGHLMLSPTTVTRGESLAIP